jgi:hypothetical protein
MTSNVGETGVKSIRLKGMKIEELPLPMAARVKDQIQLAQDTERQNAIGEIIATHPTQRVDYLEGRIAECKKSQESMNQLALTEQQRIQEYQGHIEMCKHRDRELAKIDQAVADGHMTDDYAEQQRKSLKLQFPYVIDRLQAQIDISNQSIQRFQEVTRRESGSIQELSETLALCKERDRLLKQHGVQQAVGN